MIDINEGNTNDYLFHAIFGMLLAFALFFVQFFLGIILLLFSISLFTASDGILIDREQKKFKSYKGILSYKYGNWRKFRNIESVHVVRSIDRALTSHGRMAENVIGISRSVTYDIITTDAKKSRVLIYEFQSYQDALKALSTIAKMFNVKSLDKVKDKI